MRRLKRTLVVVAAALGAVGAAHCGSDEPTQIVVTVEATPTECRVVQKTIVRVGSLDDSAAVAGERAGCDAATNRIGEFVLVPKAAPDAEVKFQIVAGIAKNAEACRADDRVDCIFARRIVRFVPQQTIRMTVVMAGACRGKTCEANETCDESGACVSAGVTPTPVADAAFEGSPEDRCAASGCLDLRSGQCRADGVCEANCGLDENCDLTCPPGIACVFKCGAASACKNVVCPPESASCDVTCHGVSACKSVECSADQCMVACDRQGSEEGTRGCDSVTLSSKNTPTLKCASSSCGTLTCVGPRACACPASDPSNCEGSDELCDNCES